MHCGARWLFQFDLQDFFYSVNEIAVYNVFKGLGYKPLLAFELARLCTTTRLPKHKKHLLLSSHRSERFKGYRFYHSARTPVGVLPQGAATSPMLSNLVAKQMDQAFATLSDELGAVYTRYADDITLSLAERLPDGVTTGTIYRRVQQIIKGHGFQSNKNKTRVAGPGSKKGCTRLACRWPKPEIQQANV